MDDVPRVQLAPRRDDACAERLLAPGTRNDLVRAVGAAARAISRDLGAGRGGVAALSLL